ncbi:nuclear transport factor 2 family protein [Sandarakinorhabdus sp.]|uniref:nuclear transport factor 2 family protein n=1 Tax=Sandarakinorhabdus sp. TaxID=1916663 RepID=UPI00333F22EC
MDNAALAEALFAALAANDVPAVQSLCSPAFSLRQNRGPAIGLNGLIKFNAIVHRIAADFGYSDAVRSATSDGFVEEHLVSGMLADGTRFAFPVCVVADVNDGLVSNVREYVDTAAAAPLLAALSRAR